MKTQKEWDYRALSFNSNIYHIILPEKDKNKTLCNRNYEKACGNLPIITGKASLVDLVNAILPQIPKPGTLCKKCMRKITLIHDNSHISDEEYEKQILAYLQKCYELQGKQILDAKQGRNNKWVGQSGCEHQIDVSLVFEDEIILAECKCFNKAVDLPLVLAFLARVMDIKPTDPTKFIHGILFSNIGFQGGNQGNIEKLQEYYNDYITVQVVFSYG